MKGKLILTLLSLMLIHSLSAQNSYHERQKRTEWFREARFGVFVHWGIYAIPARGEWVQTQEKISAEDYKKYFDNFNPVDYNPTEWAKIAKNAGMKYAVLTAKHHDGFCLFDSKFTEFKATNTPAKRDLIKEYVEAFRAEGIKVGFYYSLIDWHHPDYPNVGNHPMKGNEEWNKRKYDWDKYIKYMHNQVSELLTNYGKIDIMWFDFSFAEYKGEKWNATELVRMVRKLQPGIIIDNRLGGNMEAEHPEEYAGDFEGPEQIIPNEIVIDEMGRSIPWEACITLNNSWGYSLRDNQYKTANDVIRTLVNCVSKNGNLLLNVGPDARGRIPEKSVKVLEEVGQWMKVNGESIYGCGAADFHKPDWGRFTQKGNYLYGHILDQGIGQYYLKNMKGKVTNAVLLMDGAEMQLSDFWLGGQKPFYEKDDLFMNFGKPLQHTYMLPNKVNTVIKLKLNK